MQGSRRPGAFECIQLGNPPAFFSKYSVGLFRHALRVRYPMLDPATIVIDGRQLPSSVDGMTMAAAGLRSGTVLYVLIVADRAGRASQSRKDVDGRVRQLESALVAERIVEEEKPRGLEEDEDDEELMIMVDDDPDENAVLEARVASAEKRVVPPPPQSEKVEEDEKLAKVRAAAAASVARGAQEREERELEEYVVGNVVEAKEAEREVELESTRERMRRFLQRDTVSNHDMGDSFDRGSLAFGREARPAISSPSKSSTTPHGPTTSSPVGERWRITPGAVGTGRGPIVQTSSFYAGDQMASSAPVRRLGMPSPSPSHGGPAGTFSRSTSHSGPMGSPLPPPPPPKPRLSQNDRAASMSENYGSGVFMVSMDDSYGSTGVPKLIPLGGQHDPNSVSPYGSPERPPPPPQDIQQRPRSDSIQSASERGAPPPPPRGGEEERKKQHDYPDASEVDAVLDAGVEGAYPAGREELVGAASYAKGELGAGMLMRLQVIPGSAGRDQWKLYRRMRAETRVPTHPQNIPPSSSTTTTTTKKPTKMHKERTTATLWARVPMAFGREIMEGPDAHQPDPDDDRFVFIPVTCRVPASLRLTLASTRDVVAAAERTQRRTSAASSAASHSSAAVSEIEHPQRRRSRDEDRDSAAPIGQKGEIEGLPEGVANQNSRSSKPPVPLQVRASLPPHSLAPPPPAGPPRVPADSNTNDTDDAPKKKKKKKKSSSTKKKSSSSSSKKKSSSSSPKHAQLSPPPPPPRNRSPRNPSIPEDTIATDSDQTDQGRHPGATNLVDFHSRYIEGGSSIADLSEQGDHNQ